MKQNETAKLQSITRNRIAIGVIFVLLFVAIAMPVASAADSCIRCSQTVGQMPYDYIVYKDGSTYYFKDRNSSVIDQSTAFHTLMNSLFSTAPSGSYIVIAPGTYTMTAATTTVTGKSFTISGYGATIDASDITHNLFLFYGTAAATTTLGTVAPGDLSATVGSASNFAIGNLIKMYDGTEFTTDTDYDNLFRGELSQVDSISGTTIGLSDMTVSPYVSGTAVPITPITIKVYGLTVNQYSSTGDHMFMYIKYGKDCVVKDVNINPVGAVPFEFVDCYNTIFQNNIMENGEYVSGDGSYGYGVSFTDGSRHNLIEGNQFRWLRHGVVLSYSNVPQYGQPADTLVIGNTFTGNGLGHAIDSHLSWDINVIGNTITMANPAPLISEGNSINVGAKRTIIQDNVVKGGLTLVQTRGTVSDKQMVIKDNVFYGYNASTGVEHSFLVDFTGAADDGTFESLTIEGNEVWDAVGLVYINVVEASNIQHLDINGNTLHGSNPYSITDHQPAITVFGYQTTDKYLKDVRVNNNKMYNIADQGMFFRGVNGTANGNKIINPGMKGSASYGMEFYADTGYTNTMVVANNWIENTSGFMTYGFFEEGSSAGTAAGNTITYYNNYVATTGTKYHIHGTNSKGITAEGATASVTDGLAIVHSMSALPAWCIATPTVINETVSVTAINATTFTPRIRKITDGSAGSSQTIYWRCGL